MQYTFWILFFAVCRAVFLAYNYPLLESISWSEILQTFPAAWYLDHAAICYLMSVPVVLYTLQLFTSKLWFHKAVFVFNILFIVIGALITSTELGLYEEWGVKLNYSVLYYLKHPQEVIQTSTTQMTILAIATLTILGGAGIYGYKRLCYNTFQRTSLKASKKIVLGFVTLLLGSFLIGTGLRGGLQQIPIIQSDVYFSKHTLLNDAAVNSPWNFLHSILENQKHLEGNVYVTLDSMEAIKRTRLLFEPKKDTTIRILTTETPNVIMFVLESWSADMVYGIDSLHLGITPRVEALSRSGILFSNCYASGFRSEQGMLSIFSGIPAQPTTSIGRQPSKMKKLYCIIPDFKKRGYHTSFHFGGQLSYGNLRGYMMQNGFDNLVELKDFGDEIPKGKLGAHDEFLMDRFLEEVNHYKAPFFASAFTMSSHVPYDYPENDKLEKLDMGGRRKGYVNGVHYSDFHLGRFMEMAKKQEWYDNTLFVFVADHSHHSMKYYKPTSTRYKKIPMIWYGNVIDSTYRGMNYDKVCSQTDIPKTLLKQLNMETDKLKWSKDLFNPYQKSFMFHTFRDGFGYRDANSSYGYDFKPDKMIEGKSNQGPILFNEFKQDGHAQLQVLIDEYISY